MKPSRGLRSSGCRMWSESLNWHKTLLFIGGPMLIDTQLFSMVHCPLQEARVPKFKEIFLITWPCRAYPSTAVVNLRCRQRSAKKKKLKKQKRLSKISKIHAWVYKRDVNENFASFRCSFCLENSNLLCGQKIHVIFFLHSRNFFCIVHMQINKVLLRSFPSIALRIPTAHNFTRD